MKNMMREWKAFLQERTTLPVALAAISSTKKGQPILTKSKSLDADSTSMDSLNPEFAKKVLKVQAALRSLGYRTKLVTAYRTPASQLKKYKQGKSKVKFGKHNAVRKDGNKIVPASLAADLIWNNAKKGAYKNTPENIKYYKVLGEVAKKEGLRWGGDFAKSTPALAKFGIGWDPTHIEARVSLKKIASDYKDLVARATLMNQLKPDTQDKA